MIETVPFPFVANELGPRPEGVPSTAVTVELDPREVLEALMAYVGNKRGDHFLGHGWVQYRVGPDEPVQVRVTYWRADTRRLRP
jgi:hypothetical protein